MRKQFLIATLLVIAGAVWFSTSSIARPFCWSSRFCDSSGHCMQGEGCDGFKIPTRDLSSRAPESGRARIKLPPRWQSKSASHLKLR